MQFSISALLLLLVVVVIIIVVVIVIIIIITIIIIIIIVIISIISIIIDRAAVNRDNQVEIEIKKQSFLLYRGKTSRKYFYLKGLMESCGNLKM